MKLNDEVLHFANSLTIVTIYFFGYFFYMYHVIEIIPIKLEEQYMLWHHFVVEIGRRFD
jgi:hypothetical protein